MALRRSKQSKGSKANLGLGLSEQMQQDLQPIQKSEAISFEIMPEVEKYIMPLSPIERQNLRNNIQSSGKVYESIKVFEHEDGKHYIVDGHHRFQVIQELGLTYGEQWTAEKIVGIKTLEDVYQWMLSYQSARRNLSNEEKSFLVGREFQRRKGLAQGREQVRESVADIFGVTPRTVTNNSFFYLGVNKMPQDLQFKYLKKAEYDAEDNDMELVAKLTNGKLIDLGKSENSWDEFLEKHFPAEAVKPESKTPEKPADTADKFNRHLDKWFHTFNKEVSKKGFVSKFNKSSEENKKAFLDKIDQQMELLKSLKEEVK
ncbi:ParB/Srx family N-terminal domain-containing protein [Persicobacter psychrovividus]|uniref:ParB/Sulfiredoxin domain-containing protein n=1 Tax=Persicobacter psychrovividus TaxID=387638 RepID=A0ABM7VNA0_9BACT|nr:hypothetical protein PEPS_47730 [Persicobacter psychrovividus]